MILNSTRKWLILQPDSRRGSPDTAKPVWMQTCRFAALSALRWLERWIHIRLRRTRVQLEKKNNNWRGSPDTAKPVWMQTCRFAALSALRWLERWIHIRLRRTRVQLEKKIIIGGVAQVVRALDS